MWATWGYTCFHILQLGLQKGASIGECPTFQKKFGDRPTDLAPSEKKRKPYTGQLSCISIQILQTFVGYLEMCDNCSL
jgi:hypothetical protein